MDHENEESVQTEYIIRIKNHLNTQWENWFDGMTIIHSGEGETILKGYVIDQCALHGLLEKIRNLNLTLISVQKVELGEELVNCCPEVLRSLGIKKCHIFVFKDNHPAIAFWKRSGWEVRDDLIVMSRWIE